MDASTELKKRGSPAVKCRLADKFMSCIYANIKNKVRNGRRDYSLMLSFRRFALTLRIRWPETGEALC